MKAEVFEDSPPATVGRSDVALCVATPCYGCMLSLTYLRSILQLQGAAMQAGIPIFFDFIGNESLVQRARNVLAARFLKSNATHLLFVDADIGFNPDAVMRLLRADKDIACAAYAKKTIDWAAVRTKLLAGATEPVDQMGLDFNLNLPGRECQVVDGFVEVLDAATGFMLIKRRVFERMTDAYKESLRCVNDVIGDKHGVDEYVAFFDCMIDPDTRRYLSEDYAFCRRWQSLGGKIYADVASPLAHVGNMVFK